MDRNIYDAIFIKSNQVINMQIFIYVLATVIFIMVVRAFVLRSIRLNRINSYQFQDKTQSVTPDYNPDDFYCLHFCDGSTRSGIAGQPDTEVTVSKINRNDSPSSKP